ncbi:hypothetical protein NDA10_007219 [Ustilago hordei]|uniref:LisH domain-containing protein n=1 Tax=Ustilago hordei TaxID=120017 RepID=I2FSF2_USTHO|nr:uncharacterized protein UHO2_05759 [Ustilago hordei]KAJ1042061.1 hypothetical protein NDA10_007219 [Ustilago hordei]UTT88907.1 hypothetical protein NDA17_001570 [Ustilago hordei]CCF49845.1 uncharacterized protein UHOR_08200 [Ustilago hordei]SYW84799.1 uncharacterized protein UHO2_05759 [Ustilago hordei]
MNFHPPPTHHHHQQFQQHLQPQPSSFNPASLPPPPPTTMDTAWPGDEMLHNYLCDYLRKRDYNQAANLLHVEAGLDPTGPGPIDAPQSLLFEWWLVFWDFFTSRSTPAPVTAQSSASAVSAAGQDGRSKSLAAAALPQLDLEASRKLRLTRPASPVMIPQCMDMMSLGGKGIDGLSEEERREVGKKVNRLQTAQGEAQLRLAQLHGLQPPKGLADGMQGARLKRKESPMGEMGRVVPPLQQQQMGNVPLMRRPSQPVQAPSRLGGMVFARASPQSMMVQQQQSPAATPNGSAPPNWNPNAYGRQLSLLAPDPATLQQQRTTKYPSGLPSTLSPATEWPPSGQQLVQPTPQPLTQGNTNFQQAMPPQQKLQMSLPPTKASVFAPVWFADSKGSARLEEHSNGVGMVQGMGAGGNGERVLTPFADLEYDFKVLLSNSTQLCNLGVGKDGGFG